MKTNRKSSTPTSGATEEESDEAAKTLLQSLEEEFKKDEDKDHQLEEEFNQAMETLDKSTEDDVKPNSNVTGERRSDVPKSTLLEETNKFGEP